MGREKNWGVKRVFNFFTQKFKKASEKILFEIEFK